MQIVEMQGRFYAICPEDSEVDPVLLGEDNLRKYAFSIQMLLEGIRKANGLSGSLSQIEPDYSYMGYTLCEGRRVGFVFGPGMHGKGLLELSGLKQLCTDDNILVVFSPVSAIQNMCLRRELHLRGVVQASLVSSVDFETFCFCIASLISQVSVKETKVLAIDRERSEVTYQDKAYRVTQRQVDFLEVLCKQPSAWVPGSQIKRRYEERLDKVKNKLPAPIRKLIESHTVNGYRLNLP
jgi:hypothetical protein